MNFAAIVQDQTSNAEAVLFYVLAPITVLCAVGMLLVKKAVHSALLLAAVMISLAIFYILNEAPFCFNTLLNMAVPDGCSTNSTDARNLFQCFGACA